MKPSICALLALSSVACVSQPPSPPEPVQASASAASMPTVIDFSAYDGRTMSVEEFVKACQKLSDINFTYSESTQVALSSESMSMSGSQRIPAADFEGFLTTTLGSKGFELKHLGPAHLNVILIQRRAT